MTDGRVATAARALAIALGTIVLVRVTAWTSWHPGPLPAAMATACVMLAAVVAHPVGITTARRWLWRSLVASSTVAVASAMATASHPGPAGWPLALALFGFAALGAALVSGLALAATVITGALRA